MFFMCQVEIPIQDYCEKSKKIRGDGNKSVKSIT